MASCYQQAEQQLGRHFPRPKISFNQRGKIAGSARLQNNELRFNPTLLQENLDYFLTEVVPHEICHLLAFQLYGRVKPHGAEWKTLMSELFNLQGRVTHQLDITQVQGRQFSYRCACGPIQLSIRRHNKALKGTQYRCRRCKEPLTAS